MQGKEKAKAQVMVKTLYLPLPEKQLRNVKWIFLIVILGGPVITFLAVCTITKCWDSYLSLHTLYNVYFYTFSPHLKSYTLYPKEKRYLQFKSSDPMKLIYESAISFQEKEKFYNIKCRLFNRREWIIKIWISNDNATSQ